MIRISCYQNEMEAQTAASHLRSEGIPATVEVEDTGKGELLGVLEVDPGHSKEAVACVEGKHTDLAVACPECGSAHVLFPNRPEASPTAALVEAAAEALHLTEKTFFCHACQFEWAPGPTL